MNEERYYPGKGCQCHAHSENECCCNVDWTEPEVYELRDEVKELKKWKEAIIDELICIGIYTEEWAKDPKKALHHIACWNTEVGMHYERENRWTNRLRVKLGHYWYKTVWKLFKIQSPF
jgi:hypothetical protein